ncbi:hypothetical protein ELUMI_v1c04240 [Williamsoniiplasma luminosum]|uniref:Uncharacterized protein n=1 Tax=Williamsoniiplasma luminosum TaxID=214888 RepID=A0A2K8NVF0_9MOLU|nr:hypothetical protein [Williamsoniiplasma luminosum]ATZ17148.1 hypothetical protein ELUMI_v1c04240 [Williamsoniiplasma luminosum]
MFNELVQTFNKTRKKEFLKTNFQNIVIKWKFTDFPIILNKTEFIAILENGSGYKFSVLTKEDIFNKIYAFQNLFNEVNEATIRYLSELDNDGHKINGYNEFLKDAYALLKTYISETLIPWIFEVALDIKHQEIGIEYDPNLFFDFKNELLSLEFQKRLRKILKILILRNPGDQTFTLLDQTYEQDIISKMYKLKTMKQNSKINL